MDADGKVERLRATSDANLWINGGGFIFRRGIFDYMRDGEELVEEPFQRLIKDDQLMAFKHEGFWRPMDTLKDKEVLEDMVEQGRMPWRKWRRCRRLAFKCRAGRPDEVRLDAACDPLIREAAAVGRCRN